jgi:hypothetical protein
LQRSFGVVGWDLIEPIAIRRIPITGAWRSFAHLIMPREKKTHTNQHFKRTAKPPPALF